jgi:predicted RNase H-like nuclease
MNTWFQVLVIILSVTLTIFLFVAIAALFMVLRLLKKAKNASEKVSLVADNVSQLTGSVSKLASGGMLFSMVDRIFKKARNKR